MSLRLLRFFSAALSSEERLENLVLLLKFFIDVMTAFIEEKI